MKYISLIHALNIPCSLETCGDWHASGIQWERLHILESDNSLWGDYGIEKNKTISEHNQKYNVANHIRAILDLLYVENFTVPQGMKEDFICNSKYNEEIFNKVILMIDLLHWEQIDRFMTKEYLDEWVNFKK